MNETVLVFDDVTVEYQSPSGTFDALRRVSFDVGRGEFVAVVGPSGSGKSTLLFAAAGMGERPTSGSVRVDGHDIWSLGKRARAALRRDRIGFVFQFFNLIPTLNATQNAALPLMLRGEAQRPSQKSASQLLDRLGLSLRSRNHANQLSGGQQQRVAVARALVGKPALVFADEPTGNLDSATGEEVLDELRRAAREHGAAVVMVTHDHAGAAIADRRLILHDGMLLPHVVAAPPAQSSPSAGPPADPHGTVETSPSAEPPADPPAGPPAERRGTVEVSPAP